MKKDDIIVLSLHTNKSFMCILSFLNGWVDQVKKVSWRAWPKKKSYVKKVHFVRRLSLGLNHSCGFAGGGKNLWRESVAIASEFPLFPVTSFLFCWCSLTDMCRSLKISFFYIFSQTSVKTDRVWSGLRQHSVCGRGRKIVMLLNWQVCLVWQWWLQLKG